MNVLEEKYGYGLDIENIVINNKTEWTKFSAQTSKIFLGDYKSVQQAIFYFRDISKNSMHLKQAFVDCIQISLNYPILFDFCKFLKRAFDKKELEEKLWSNNTELILGDVLNVFWIKNQKNTEFSEKLVKIVQNLIQAEILSSTTLEKTVSIELLGKLKILEANMHQKFINVQKSLLFYKQIQYNLLHESNEGFSRLIDIIINTNSTDNFSKIPKIPLKITSKISLKNKINFISSHYALSPERVLDIILENLEQKMATENFGKSNQNFKNTPKKNLVNSEIFSVLKNYSRRKIADTVGHKIRFYSSEANRKQKIVPSSLIALIAFLINNKIFDFEDIFQYLPGEIEKIEEKWKYYCEEMEKEIKNAKLEPIDLENMKITNNIPAINRPNIHVPCKTKNNCLSYFHNKGDIIKKCNSCHNKKIIHSTCSNLNSGLKFCLDCLKNETRFELIAYLIEMGNLEKAKLAATHIPPEICAFNFQILNSTSKIISKHLELTTFITSSAKNGDKTTALKNWLDQLDEMMSFTKHHIFEKPTLLTKICDKMAVILDQFPSDELPLKVFKIIKNYLIPAISSINSSYTAATALWAVLQKLNSQSRYALYGWWLNEANKMAAEPRFSLKVALLQCLRFRKMNLHKNDKARSSSCAKPILKFLHKHPVSVIDDLLRNLMHRGYEAVIKYLVQSFKFASGIVFDIVIFAIINILSEPGKTFLEPYGNFLSVWYQNLILFASEFISEYLFVDFRPLIQYIYFSINKFSITNLHILNSLIAKKDDLLKIPLMEISKNDVFVLNYSSLLGSILTEDLESYVSNYNLKRYKNSVILFALHDTALIFPFIIKMSSSNYVQYVNEDNVSNTIQSIEFQTHLSIQTFFNFVEFLRTNLKDEEFLSYLPTLFEMKDTFNIPLREIFFLTRKYLFSKKYAIKCISDLKMDKEDFRNDVWNYLFKFTETLENASEIRKQIPLKIFTAFWAGDLCDIKTPLKEYELTLDKIEKYASKIENGENSKEDSKLVLHLKSKIEREFNRRQKCSIKDDLIKFFGDFNESNICDGLIEFCILPRCVFTPFDALYCSRLIYLLLTHKTQSITFATFSECFLACLPSLIECLTTSEASNLGRFLEDILGKFFEICESREKFKAIVEGNFCFRNSRGAQYQKEDLNYIVFRIHDRIFKTFASVFYACGAKRDFLQHKQKISNIAQILRQTSDVFPRFFEHISETKMLINKIISLLDENGNLKTILTSLLGLLERNKKVLNSENFSSRVRRNASKRKMESIKKQLLLKQQINQKTEKQNFENLNKNSTKTSKNTTNSSKNSANFSKIDIQIEEKQSHSRREKSNRKRKKSNSPSERSKRHEKNARKNSKKQYDHRSRRSEKSVEKSDEK